MRSLHRLTAVAVAKFKTDGLHADGRNLYLRIEGSARSWVFRYSRNGKTKDMGLGSALTITLAEAREQADQCRRLLAMGHDPMASRNAMTKAMTFKEAAEAYSAAHGPSWGAKHKEQWTNSLARYAYPSLAALSVQALDAPQILKVVQPIWTTKTETASRLRRRIESILDWATSSGHRSGDNPARWRGHMEHLLPASSRRAIHHAALPYIDAAPFMAKLADMQAIASPALQFLILTAARTGEVIGAQWDEIDLSKSLWSIPAQRMKSERDHRVPLSAASMAIVERMASMRTSTFIFPGEKPGRPLGKSTMLKLLSDMGHEDLTVHGFRSTFRDWAAEQTGFPNEVIEMALAHAIGDKTEAAYRRGDLLEKRKLLMQAWASHTNKTTAEVVQLRKIS